MSDYLSPLLVVMQNEVDAFWAFVALMERVVSWSDFNYCLLYAKHLDVRKRKGILGYR